MPTVLFAAVGLILYGSTRILNRTFHGQLNDLLPTEPSGWTRTSRSIADTPEMKSKIAELLNYDQGVYYDYTNGPLRLSVYAAYWQPGKKSARLVAGHTPDVCWVGAGWNCTERSKVSFPFYTSRSELLSSIPKIFPAESRTFVINGTTEHVWFWHIVDGEIKSYSMDKQPPWHAMFSDIITSKFNQRAEQFFIRLSSPQPFDEPALAPVLSGVLRTLPLAEETPNNNHAEDSLR